MTLHQQIPAITNVGDQHNLERILEAIRANLLVMGGDLGDGNNRSLTVSDLKKTGQLGEENGVLFGKNIKDSPDMEQQTSPPSNIGTWMTFSANFRVGEGKGIGEYGLGSLPENSYLMNVWIDVVSVFTSETHHAALSLQLFTPEDIYAKHDVDSSYWAEGQHQCLQDGSAGSFLGKTSTQQSIKLIVETEALISGELNFYAQYAVTT